MRWTFHSAAHLAASSGRSEATRSRARLQAALGILLVINAVLLFLLFRSPGQSSAARQEELARMETRHREARNQVQEMRDLTQKVQTAIQNGQQFARQNFLPRSSAFSAMLANLEKLASRNRLQPGDINYRMNEPENELGWVNVEVALTIEGDYPDLVRFINQLEQEKVFWIIQSLDVSGSGGAQLRLNLQTQTYLLPS